MDYLVVIEQGADGSYSAYVPDLPGCAACGDTRDEAAQQIEEAIALHIESLREHGEPLPGPTDEAHYG
jgi:predicted RNase H-like HicB family nuclease